MVKCELVYFAPGRGRAELARYIMHQARIPFEDRRITIEEFGPMKSKISTGSLPVMFVDGKELNEGMAIVRYLADAAGLLGKSQWEKAQADSVSCQISSFMENNESFIHWMHDNAYMMPDKAIVSFKEYKTNVVSKFAARLNTLIERTGTGFLVGNELTYPDLQAAELVDRIMFTDKTCFNNFPRVLQHHQKIHFLPNLQSYLKARPQVPW